MKLVGDWGKAAKLASGLQGRWDKSVRQATLREGHYLRAKIVRKIRSGPFPALSPLTIAVRKFRGFGGSKPLVSTGALIGSVTVVSAAGGVFVGILRQAKGKGGKSMANIGEIQEFGRTWTQPFSQKSRRFLFAVMKKAGLSKDSAGVRLAGGAKAFKDKGGRWRGGSGRFLSGQQLAQAKAAEAQQKAARAASKGGGSSGTITITIPARPFMGPVFEAEQAGVAKRFWSNVSAGMGYDLGKA